MGLPTRQDGIENHDKVYRCNIKPVLAAVIQPMNYVLNYTNEHKK